VTPSTKLIRHKRAGRYWAGQFVIAAAVLMAGGSKFAGSPAMIALFNAVGIGQWFRYLTATIEVGSAIARLVPSLAPHAFALVATMTSAVFTHLFIVGDSALPAQVLGAGSAANRMGAAGSILKRRRLFETVFLHAHVELRARQAEAFRRLRLVPSGLAKDALDRFAFEGPQVGCGRRLLA
jgi:putative oxidoreductase